MNNFYYDKKYMQTASVRALIDKYVTGVVKILDIDRDGKLLETFYKFSEDLGLR